MADTTENALFIQWKKKKTDTERTFSRRVMQHLEYRGWGKQEFLDRVDLPDNYFYKIKRNEMLQPTVKNVFAIGIGLELEKHEIYELLDLANHKYACTDEENVYFFCLERYQFSTAEEFNAIYSRALGKPGLKPIGSIA